MFHQLLHLAPAALPVGDVLADAADACARTIALDFCSAESVTLVAVLYKLVHACMSGGAFSAAQLTYIMSP